MRWIKYRRAMPGAFDADAEPSQISSVEVRTDERQQLEAALAPLRAGEAPEPIALFGRLGSGKTVTTHRAIDRVRRRSSDGIRVIRLDGASHGTAYQLAVQIVSALRPDDGVLPANRLDRETARMRLQTEISALESPHVLVIDGLDAVSDPTAIQEWITAPTRRESGTSPSLAFVAIFDAERGFDLIEEPIDGSPFGHRIEFEPFPPTALIELLDARIERDDWTYPLAYGVVDMCAALIAQDRSNARRALALLHLAGVVATDEGADTISTTHVTRAYDRLQRLELDALIEGLSERRQLVLLALTAADETRTATVYDRYRSLCHDYGRPVLSERAVHDHLKALERDGVLVASENRTGSRGNYHTYDVLVDDAILEDALQVGVNGSLEPSEETE